MTIENKTSFQRLKDENFAMMYLGGFANRHQIEFLKKLFLIILMSDIIIWGY